MQTELRRWMTLVTEMAKRVGHQTYEVAQGIQVMPIYDDKNKIDGWQVLIDGDYDLDFASKREAVGHAVKKARELGRKLS